jgi:cell wall-associated NlpC family hydrolase
MAGPAILGAAAFAVPIVMSLGVALAAGASGAATQSSASVTSCGTAPVQAGRTVDGVTLDSAQLGNAQIIYDVSVTVGLPQRAAVIAEATAMQESRLINLPSGTSDSLGLFQQRPSMGWGTPAQVMQPVYAATKFYSALVKVPGWQSLPLTVAAQAVQGSAYPNAYAKWEPLASSLAATFSGVADNCLSDNGDGGASTVDFPHLPKGFALPPGTPAAVVAAIRYAVAQLGKPYVFSGGPGGQITLNSSVCPAQKADAGNTSGATGVVQATLDPEQRCVAAAAILYAAAQLGKPYLSGGTGPDAFDCSGLVMMAYRAAGIVIPRTSQEQWAAGPRVPPGHEQPGDLVFFAGSDGTPQAPGHVGLVIGGGEMIEAYATGYPIRISAYGLPTSPPGDQVVVGFTRPS